MRGLALLSVMTATSAHADSFQGLTLGAQIPDTISPVSSTLITDRGASDALSEYEKSLCMHELVLNGRGFVQAVTETCDGDVVLVIASRMLRPFFDTDQDFVPVETGVDTLVFGETTLAEIRAQFCSEGLIAAPYLGQQDPDVVGIYTLAYQFEDRDAYVTFSLAHEMPYISTPTTEAYRDTAKLATIGIMSARLFDLTIQGVVTPSAGYVPIPKIFADGAVPTVNCTLS